MPAIPSLQTLAKHPLNTVAPYFTMFPPEFPLAALDGVRGWVLDPFCGRGTTNFAARVLGLPSIGIDSSPIAAAIASAKLATADAERVVALARSLIRQHADDAEPPSGRFWELAYHPRTLREVCAIRLGLLHADPSDQTATMLRAIMLGALHGPRGAHTQSYFSNQMPRTYATKPAAAVRFWESRGMRPDYVPAIDVIKRRARRACADLPPPVPGAIVHGDARFAHLPDGTGPFSAVVTSPPYFGMRTYVTDQWLRHWFLGGPAEPDYAANRQLDAPAPGEFARELARVWNRIAERCAPGCRLVIRFGALPSVPSDPASIIADSIRQSTAGWELASIADAGTADIGRRQAQQFGFVRSKPIPEVDVTAVLRG